MPKRDKLVYLKDVVSVCDELQVLYNDAGEYNGFISNNYMVRAAERCLQIVGEALYHINNYDRTIAISYKQQIIGLRHMITHDYDMISTDRMWLYIRDFVPLLKSETLQIIEQLENVSGINGD